MIVDWSNYNLYYSRLFRRKNCKHRKPEKAHVKQNGGHCRRYQK